VLPQTITVTVKQADGHKGRNTDLNTRVTHATVWTAWWTIHQTSGTPLHPHSHSSYIDILEERSRSSIFSFYLIFRSCKATKNNRLQPNLNPHSLSYEHSQLLPSSSNFKPLSCIFLEGQVL